MEIKETLAAILVETGKPLVVDTIKLPDSLDPGQVLVQLITSGICGAQLNEIDAIKGPDKFLPHLLGHEGYAQVIETGPGVVKVRPGDSVVMHWRPSTGIQSLTPKYGLNSSIVNAGWVTTFNQYAVVSENRITRVFDSVNKYFMPLLGCALTTALGVLENDAKFSHRDTLLITGFGGVGNAIFQFAKFMRARRIIVLDKDESKKEEAFKLGADFFIVAQDIPDALDQLTEIVAEIGKPTVAIETTGNSMIIELCYEITADVGRVVLVGVPKFGDKVSIYTLPLHFGKSVTGSKGGNSIPDVDIPFILDLVERGEIKESNFPVIKMKFETINTAINSLRTGINGRLVLEF